MLQLSAATPWSLQQCLERAEQRNLSVRNAELDAQLAERAKEQAYWSFLPNLNAAATHGYNWGQTIDRFTNTFATDRVRSNNFYLSSEVALFQSGRKHRELEVAKLDEEAAKRGFEAARNDIRTEVARAFINVLGLRERLVVAEQQIALTNEQIAVTRAMVEAGRVPRSEVYDNEAQLAQEEYSATDLRNQVDLALLSLGQLLQLDPEEMNDFDIAAPAVEATAVVEPRVAEGEVMARVLADNPAYARAQIVVNSADQQVRIARTQGLPTISMNASMGTGYSGRNLEGVGPLIMLPPSMIGATAGGEAVYSPNYTQDTRVRAFGNQWSDNLNESVGLTLSVPIFNNMRARYGIEQAKVGLERAKIERDVRRNNLQVDVQNAITAQRGAYRQYESARRAVSAAEESMRYAQERFEHRTGTAIELNTAKARVQRSTADLINAKYTYLMAAMALEILQGRNVAL